MLRNLLREHLRRIYLYAYEESRNRAAAIDRTRRTVLRVARTMESIPAGCPLVTWVFLALEEARVPPAENPDVWRLLVISEEERRAAGPDTASHPMLRPLVLLYRRFLDVPDSGDVEPRANWPAAEADLDCFLCAQFAESEDAACRPAPVWRRWLAARPWSRPRNIAAAAITVGVVAIAFVVGFTLAPPKGRRTTFAGSANPSPRDSVSAGRFAGRAEPARPINNASVAEPGRAPADRAAESSSRPQPADCQVASARAARGFLARGTASARINGPRCESVTRDSLRFAWMPARAVTEYRLCLITAKRDTLGIVPSIMGTCVIVPVKGVPHMSVPGSFIFRVDGLANGQLVATSDPQPFEVP